MVEIILSCEEAGCCVTTLRPYQQYQYEQIPRLLAKHKHIIVQDPPGAGKSVIISHTVRRIQAAGKVALVLTHRTKIHSQLVAHCQAHPIQASTDHITIDGGGCYVAMNQTLVRRPFILQQLQQFEQANQLIIITDECRNGNFCKVFDMLPSAMRIGFDATPAWKWAKFLPNYYKALLPGPQIKQLQEEGHLVPFEYYEMQTKLDGLKKGTNGEFTEASQDDVFGEANIYDGLVEQLRSFAGSYSKGLIFCASIKSCEKLYEQLTSEGFNPVRYHSALSKADGAYQMAAFTQHNTSNLLLSVSALSEGFDYPPLDFEVLYRATSSLPLFIQMGMRCSRPSPRTGKTRSIILDFGGNHTRHKSMTMDRDWEALWRPPPKLPKTGAGVANIAYCPVCEFIVSPLAKSCPNCGHIFPEAEVKLREGILVRIQQEEDSLRGKRLSQLTAAELVVYSKMSGRTKLAVRVARALDQTTPGYLAAFAKEMGYKNGWLHHQSLMSKPGEKILFTDVLIR